MSTENPFQENNEGKLPSSLNILTILTLIGSVLGLGQGIYGYFSADKSVETMEKTMNDPGFKDMPEMVKKMLSPEILDMAKKAAANKLPIMILAVLGSALCLFAAMQMRKQKMQGYYIYLIGELLPTIGGMLFLGLGTLSGWSLLGYLFPVIFIVLYTFQRKHLINN
jgi:hypothetical protein